MSNWNLTKESVWYFYLNYIIADRKEIDKQNLNRYTISDRVTCTRYAYFHPYLNRKWKGFKMVSLSKISVRDKISLAAGTGFWHFGALPRYEIEGIHVSDGPSGLRRQRQNTGYIAKRGSSNAVCFPCEAGMAASFDRDLLLPS